MGMHREDRQVDLVGRSQGRRSGRERVLEAAYALFTERGLRQVGVDRVIERAGVAKMTLYRNFPTKADLVQSVLERRDTLWTDWLFEEAARRSEDPRSQLLALFEVLDAWIRREDFEGCTFITSLIEAWPDDPVILPAAREHLDRIHRRVRILASSSGAGDPERVAGVWDVLMRGAIVSAQAGDHEAGQHALELAKSYLASSGRGVRKAQDVGSI